MFRYDIVTIQGYYPLRGGGDSAFLCHGWPFSCSISISLCNTVITQGYCPLRGEGGSAFLCCIVIVTVKQSFSYSISISLCTR